MKLANPIYDSVFKYLLDDNEVAKILISNILNVKIETLQLEPTEINHAVGKRDFTVFRVDFKATITHPNEEKQVVLIEIQKAKLESDIIRFRKYLGSQYMNPNNTYPDNPFKAIPIYTIYFLGKTLSHAQKSPIINVNRNYVDNYTKEILEEKEEFIECLTHNSTVIQIPLFKTFRRNRLEKLLAIFESSTRHEIEVEELEDEEYQKITRRLIMANSDEQIRKEMDLEDEILSELNNLDRKIANLEKETEDAIAREAEERRQKEEERRQKEEVKATLVTTVVNMQKMGLSIEQIAELTDKTIDEVTTLLNSI